MYRRNILPKSRHGQGAAKLFKNDFFIPVPGEFYNHMESGRITPAMWCVYSMVLRQVDFETGFWQGSAFKIHAGWGSQMHLRTVQDNLAKLCEIGFLKSFHVKNARGNYPVAVEGYFIRFGPLKGHRLNAQKTTNPQKPVYERDPATAQPSPDPQASDDLNSLKTKGDKGKTTAQQRREGSRPTGRSAQSPRNDRADTAQRPRNDRARGVSPNARIPDYPDFPALPDLKEGKDGQGNTPHWDSSPSLTGENHGGQEQQDNGFSRAPGNGEATGDPLAEEARGWVELHGSLKDFAPSDPEGWTRRCQQRLPLARAYFAWLLGKWPDLNLIKSEKERIQAFFWYCDAPVDELLTAGQEALSVIQKATHLILDDLNVTNSFDNAGSKLSAMLSEKFDAIVSRREKERREEELMKRETRRARTEGEKDLAILDQENRAKEEYTRWLKAQPLMPESPFEPSPDYADAFERFQLRERMVDCDAGQRPVLEEKLAVLRQAAWARMKGGNGTPSEASVTSAGVASPRVN